MIDEKQLAEWEALANAASPGPWTTNGKVVRQYSDETSKVIAYINSEDDHPWGDDALLVAAARTAMPELIAEVRRLRLANSAHEAREAAAARELTGDLHIRRAERERCLEVVLHTGHTADVTLEWLRKAAENGYDEWPCAILCAYETIRDLPDEPAERSSNLERPVVVRKPPV
jgi:hypothetical protein